MPEKESPRLVFPRTVLRWTIEPPVAVMPVEPLLLDVLSKAAEP